MNVYEYPLVVLMEVQRLYKTIKKIVDVNSDLIEISNDEPFNLIIQGPHPKVYYRFIGATLLPDGKIDLRLEYCPKMIEIILLIQCH